MLYYILLIVSIFLMLYGIIGLKTGKVGGTTICLIRDKLTSKIKFYKIKKQDIEDFSLDDDKIKLLNYYDSLSVADKLLLINKLEVEYINRFQEQNVNLTIVE